MHTSTQLAANQTENGVSMKESANTTQYLIDEPLPTLTYGEVGRLLHKAPGTVKNWTSVNSTRRFKKGIYLGAGLFSRAMLMSSIANGTLFSTPINRPDKKVYSEQSSDGLSAQGDRP
jgi:hypothetical protein